MTILLWIIMILKMVSAAFSFGKIGFSKNGSEKFGLASAGVVSLGIAIALVVALSRNWSL